MIIKQKIRPGRKPVEYTFDELETLAKLITRVWTISLAVAIVNFTSGLLILDDDGSMVDLGFSGIMVMTLTTLAVGLAAYVIVRLAITLGVKLQRPLLVMISRHLAIPKFNPFGMSELCNSIKEKLADWFEQVSFYKVLISFTATCIINIITLVCLVLFFDTNWYAYLLFIVGCLSIIVLIPWAVATHCVPEEDDDIVVRIVSENANSGAPEDPAT